MKDISLEYLRKIYNLGVGNVISDEIKETQEKTILSILNILSERPGVILGDDVGMGKTYMAIGTALLFLKSNPKDPVIIITPGWELNKKWRNDIRKFIERNYIDSFIKEDDIGVIEKSNSLNQIEDLINLSKNKKIIITPSNIFNSGSYKRERSFFANCWFRHRGLRGTTRNKFIKILGLTSDEVYNPLEYKDMWIDYRDIADAVYEPLDKLYNEEGIENENKFLNALYEVRYNAINYQLPKFSLFILDEAHKIKNENTIGHQALLKVLSKKYKRTLFLTATPFQLQPGELLTITNLFINGDIPRKEEKLYKEEMDKFQTLLYEYQSKISLFDHLWNNLRPHEVVEVENILNNSNSVNESSNSDVLRTLEHYNDLLDTKEKLENTMRSFIIRNIKDKSGYRKESIGSLVDDNKNSIELMDEHFIPFALWEKVLHNIYLHGGSTFVPSVKQSLTSSYEAVKASSIFSKEDEDLNEILKPLENIIDTQKSHPKMKELLQNVKGSLKDGEKTLIFVERVDTAKTIERKINEMISKEYDNKITNYQKRFYNKNDNAWFYLQENYIYTILPYITGKVKHGIKASQIAEEVSILYKKYNTSKKPNYMYIKRIVEHVVFKRLLNNDKLEKFKKNNIEIIDIIKSAENILNLNYIKYGLNLKLDKDEIYSDDTEENDFRKISNALINNILDNPGIWADYKVELKDLLPEERDEVVDALIGFLRRDKSFFIELKTMDAKSDDELPKIIKSVFKKGKGFKWNDATKRFLQYYNNAAMVERENMLLGLKQNSVAVSLTGETHDKSKVIEGFNTPFYPMVVVSMPSSQEGLDLQRECRRIIHYDLCWNPASLEQRVGRIDRINSLTSRMVKENKDTKLEVYLPFIKNTIDEHIYKTVKSREKWFSFILGGTPDWESFSLDDDIKPLPVSICKKLQIDLSVK